MHTFRLLGMAKEIATEGTLRVRRPNPEALLRVRAGEFSYDDLVRRAEEQLDEVRAAFACSSLPEAPDRDAACEVLLEIRAGMEDGW
jgi:hypothetical protein